MDCSPTRLLCAWNFPGKNTGVGCHFLLQEIFPTQGSALRLLQFQAGSLPLSHQGSPGFKLLVFALICYTAVANTYTFTLKRCCEEEAVALENDNSCPWLCADCLAACWGLVGSVSRASGGSVGKDSAWNPGDRGDAGSIPGWGRSCGGGNGNPFQYSCQKNPMDRGAWWTTVHGAAKSGTRLSEQACMYTPVSQGLAERDLWLGWGILGPHTEPGTGFLLDTS